MSDKFFTSDSHFGHSNIIRYCNRPFHDREEMNEAMVKNWNAKVRPNDEVFHLGDFAFGSGVNGKYAQEFLNRLNGRIYLIQGNHEEAALEAQYSGLPGKKFLWVKQYHELKVDGQWIVLFHYPIRSWNRIMKGSWHLFGHTHGGVKPFGKSLEVGVDLFNFSPVSFDELKVEMEKRKQVSEEKGFQNYP